jgi:nucleotide-binding universal stress UspA family protein
MHLLRSMEPFRIVAVLDRSELSQMVLEHALDHANREELPELHFVTIVEDPHASLDDVKEWMTAQILEEIDLFRGEHPDWSGHIHVRYGWADREIPAFARAIGANLVILAANDEIGRIATAMPCPFLVVSLDEPGFETGTCPDCAAIRLATDGDRMFCDAHAADQVSLRIPEAQIVGGSNLIL